MKRFFITCLCLVTSTLFVCAMDFSFSDGANSLSARINKEGDFVKINYSITTPVTSEMRQGMGSYSPSNVNMKMEIIASCSEHKMKISSIDIPELSQEQNLMSKITGTWFPITKQEDLDALKNICTNR